MKGVTLQSINQNTQLKATLEPLLIEDGFDAKSITRFVRRTDFANYFIVEENIFELCDILRHQLLQNTMDPIEGIIGEAKDAIVEINVLNDGMRAELTITAAYGGKTPDTPSIISLLKDHEVTRGVSKKRIDKLLEQISTSPPGAKHLATVAKGLPPRKGKNSILKPIVPNALERALIPQKVDQQKVDMREFGEIICVTKDQVVAKRIPPKKGRDGYSVTNELIPAEEGTWLDIKMGNNVYISEQDENTVCAQIEGLPKFASQRISVDDVYVTRGVNVATGNIKYAGAVIVNGDVTEKMRIESDGDVTVNGFVESAHIKSGGDIIITQGASGKIQERDCVLEAGGSLFIRHGQGLVIKTHKDLCIEKQMAHSFIRCGGKLTVGVIDNPMGKIFACKIDAFNQVEVGSLGAISGSEMSIDYTEGYQALLEKLDSMTNMYEDLSSKNADHEIKIASINSKTFSTQGQKDKQQELNKELELERVFLNWLRVSQEEVKEKLTEYKQNAKVIINKNMFPGATMIMEENTWRAEKEFTRCQVIYQFGKWKRVANIR